MINWITLQDIEELREIKESSAESPVIIFKHSTRCPISTIAKSRLEKNWGLNGKIKAYFLDLIAKREISNEIAEVFQVEHASPQLLLIQDGNCTWNTSHLDISTDKLESALG